MRYVLALLVVALLLVSCGSAPEAAAPTPMPTSGPPTVAATVAPTAKPTLIPPTEPPTNTLTPKPTATPTEVPSPTPEPTDVPPVVLSGKGQSVTDPFTPPSSVNRVIFAHDGKRNFIVTLYKPDGSSDILVNKIGRYAGIRPMVGGDGKYYFEVKADGGWLIRIEPIGGEPSAAQGISGQGDYASGVFKPTTVGPVPFLFKHTGESNFIVQIVCAGGSDYVENEIGPVDGAAVVNFKKGPCFWGVEADGEWSIKPK